MELKLFGLGCSMAISLLICSRRWRQMKGWCFLSPAHGTRTDQTMREMKLEMVIAMATLEMEMGIGMELGWDGDGDGDGDGF